jgi:hypothetical protein
MDEIIIHFNKDASNNFKEGEDLYKWFSMLENAMEARMVIDGNESSLNRHHPLGNEAYDVPVSFRCSYPGTYTVDASGIQSFNGAALIWIEDKKTGAPWHSLVDDPVYTFTAGPDEPEDRFVVHFFGTQGIEDPDAEESINIYGSKQYVYVINELDETIEDINVYDILGNMIKGGEFDNTTINRIYVGDKVAVYIVEVITERRIYTRKVMLTN